MGTFNEFTRERNNFWERNGEHYRLFASSVTPNGCWLVNAEMRKIEDYDIATGKTIYDKNPISFEIGVVPACFPYIYNPRTI